MRCALVCTDAEPAAHSPRSDAKQAAYEHADPRHGLPRRIPARPARRFFRPAHGGKIPRRSIQSDFPDQRWQQPMGAAAQTTRGAAAVGARRRPRVPRVVGFGRHRGARGEDLRPVRGRCGDRLHVLPDGASRRPRVLGPEAARNRQQRRARCHVRRDEPCTGIAPQAGPEGAARTWRP